MAQQLLKTTCWMKKYVQTLLVKQEDEKAGLQGWELLKLGDGHMGVY